MSPREHGGKTAIATLHLMCGLPCSGKTTVAKVIEREQHALRLTADDWIMLSHGNDAAAARDGTIRTSIEAALLDLGLRVLSLGVNVVLDFGVWSRSEREEFRARAARVGARSELHFLDVPADELWRRIEARNAAPPWDEQPIRRAHLDEWRAIFQAPDEVELALFDAPPSTPVAGGAPP